MTLIIELADNVAKNRDIIGLKEDIAMRLESVVDIVHIDVIEKELVYEYPQEKD